MPRDQPDGNAMQRVHSEKFDDGAAARSYAEEAGWRFVRRAGWLRRFREYAGYTREVGADASGPEERAAEWRLRVYDDGRVELHGDTGRGELPAQVYASVDDAFRADRLHRELDVLFAAKGLRFDVSWDWGGFDERKIHVYTVGADGRRAEMIAEMDSFDEAREWIESFG